MLNISPLPTTHAPLPVEQMLEMFKSLGEGTRLRILVLLRHGDLAVGELVQILCLSQPRLSHHMKSMVRAGIVTRLPEGSWVFYRLTSDPQRRAFIDDILQRIDSKNADFERDRISLASVREARTEAAEVYFSNIAEDWDKLRSLQSPREKIEKAMLESAGSGPFRYMIDIGTGTGRMLTLFSTKYAHAEGIDLSHKMLTVARANLSKTGVKHASVRQGDALSTPFTDESADLITLHQVLHFVDWPERVITEAARILAPGGRLIIVDFAPHTMDHFRTEYGHRRLGISHDSMRSWTRMAGLDLQVPKEIFPPPNMTDGLCVYVWTAIKPLSYKKIFT